MLPALYVTVRLRHRPGNCVMVLVWWWESQLTLKPADEAVHAGCGWLATWAAGAKRGSSGGSPFCKNIALRGDIFFYMYTVMGQNRRTISINRPAYKKTWVVKILLRLRRVDEHMRRNGYFPVSVEEIITFFIIFIAASNIVRIEKCKLFWNQIVEVYTLKNVLKHLLSLKSKVAPRWRQNKPNFVMIAMIGPLLTELRYVKHGPQSRHLSLSLVFREIL